MPLHCWDVHDQIAFAAVVFAESEAEAIWLGELHKEAFLGRVSPMMTAIERRPGPNGAAADWLKAAAAVGVPGMGYLQDDGSWIVLPPGEQEPKVFRPAPTELIVFFDGDGDEVVFFARDHYRAGDLYDAIRDRFDLLPEGMTPHAWEAWTTVGLVRHGIQARQRGVEGVGVYDSERGWHILPLDYVALEIDPPDK